MEKFKIYSNDPYDFNDLDQIKDFFKLLGKQEVLKKITETNKDKIYLKILADKKENNVEVSLIQDRSKEVSKIKLPDLVLEYFEFSLKEANQYLDLTEYTYFD